MKQFPQGFLWGASTSSFQVEGGEPDNDWEAAARAGKVPPIGIACDHYRRYEEDFDIAKSLGHNAHRFSIEWARVEPEEGKFDEKELEHYRVVVRALKARGIEPFVELWHFALPRWFSETKNFRRRDGAALFARYATKVAEALPDVRFFLTMNEPLVWLGEQGEVVGASPAPHKNFLVYLMAFEALTRAHRAAYRAVKAVLPHAQVGVAKHNFSFVGRGFFGTIFADVSRYLWNRRFLNALKGHQDFIGVQYYQELYYWQSEEERKARTVTDIGWQIHPEGIYNVLMELKRHYNLPIYVTENGVADRDDRWRANFIRESLTAVQWAIEQRADVRGYLHWSLMDNYELAKGYAMQFGLIHIDRDNNLTRTIRPSAQVYAEICKANAL